MFSLEFDMRRELLSTIYAVIFLYLYLRDVCVLDIFFIKYYLVSAILLWDIKREYLSAAFLLVHVKGSTNRDRPNYPEYRWEYSISFLC